MTLVYFGLYNPQFSRNKIYIQGLRSLGVNVLECQDSSPGILKYWRLLVKYWKIADSHDALIVGYPGHLLVPFARLLSRKPVIADLLGSLEDAEVYSHNPSFFKKIKARIVDRLAVWCAHTILLESEAQKKFFIEKFGYSEKYQVVYTGVGSEFEAPFVQEHKTDKKFIVLFRGRLTPESGIGHILGAAELLKSHEYISFIIIGGGQLLTFTEQDMQHKNLHNVTLISRFLSDEELVTHSKSASLALGQFEQNSRLGRTIPHKAFESFALGIPYLTGDASAISELVIDGETGFLIPLADSETLAQKIISLSKNPELLKKVSFHEKEMFQKKLSSKVLAQRIVMIIEQIKNPRK